MLVVPSVSGIYVSTVTLHVAFGSKVTKLRKRALRLPIMREIVLMLIAAYCALNYAGIMCACLVEALWKISPEIGCKSGSMLTS